MVKMGFRLICTFFVFISLLCSVMALTGSGTSEDPYLIYDCNDLQLMQNDLDAYYALANDIDCSDTINWNSGAGFDPIGDSLNLFIGTLDGQNKIISNLFINRTGEDYVGLFGYADISATVQNIGLDNFEIKGANYVGGIFGLADDFLIYKSYTTGSVNGSGDYVGGLGGVLGSSSYIWDCYSEANVDGVDEVGGLVGYIKHSEVEKSFAIGNVNGNSNIGGLIGSFSHSPKVRNSFSTGNVSGASNVGGFVGKFLGLGTPEITNSYWNNHSGNPSSCIVSGTFTNCYAIDNDESHFYYRTNVPLSSWDFDNVWVEQGGDYPIFIWQQGLLGDDMGEHEDEGVEDEDCCKKKKKRKKSKHKIHVFKTLHSSEKPKIKLRDVIDLTNPYPDDIIVLKNPKNKGLRAWFSNLFS